MWREHGDGMWKNRRGKALGCHVRKVGWGGLTSEGFGHSAEECASGLGNDGDLRRGVSDVETPHSTLALVDP